MKDEYDITGRLRFEAFGNPTWNGEQGRLELVCDEIRDTFRALQSVTVPDSRRDSPLASHEATLDVGANNLVACTTTTSTQLLYEGRDIFERFHETTEKIAHYQSQLDD